MTLLEYDKDSLQKRLSSLPHEKRLAFGLSCCERLIGNYVAFRKDEGWGDETVLRTTLERLWSLLSGHILRPKEIAELTNNCEAVAPNSDNFDALLTSAAQDAVFAICSVLDYLADGEVSRLARTSGYAIDSIDLYVQEIESMSANLPDLEERIRAHPLMQREIGHQYRTLEFLEEGGSASQVREFGDVKGEGNLEK